MCRLLEFSVDSALMLPCCAFSLSENAPIISRLYFFFLTASLSIKVFSLFISKPSSLNAASPRTDTQAIPSELALPRQRLLAAFHLIQWSPWGGGLLLLIPAILDSALHPCSTPRDLWPLLSRYERFTGGCFRWSGAKACYLFTISIYLRFSIFSVFTRFDFQRVTIGAVFIFSLNSVSFHFTNICFPL